MNKLLLVIVVLFFTVGCESKVKEGRSAMMEQCYDGVVYISQIAVQSLTVKFNADGTVSTETFDGQKCK